MFKRIGIGISLTLTALPVIAAAWFMTFGYLFLAQEIIVKPHYARAVTQFKALPVESGDTVFLGDSLTEYETWYALFPDTPVRNRGSVGDDTAGALARLGEVTAGSPAQVFLMIGTNDLTYGLPESQIVANVERIVSAIKADSPRTKVFVQSLLPRATEGLCRPRRASPTPAAGVSSDSGAGKVLEQQIVQREGSEIMATTQKATFGAGCFWSVEAAFRQVPGVVDTAVGYAVGTTQNPTCEEVIPGMPRWSKSTTTQRRWRTRVSSTSSGQLTIRQPRTSATSTAP
jgi:hypothetical protein